ncbi:TetR family transcriptional regulator [Nonomuraea phyllanthi]|uniref:TetR/AcrR family transcriptional regulator n=1 Tax=Nonomuraea phyllanthi TaxID=2219224 RepID=UPI001293D8CF|nr:TetR family transcriptional regulator [Nonomuraea phyllanthi]QFY11036.1 TetR family transcriptional regulator [Nonomuraea phyllanthi]
MGVPGGGEREAILRSAMRLFAALGYDGTSLDQIADTAGVETTAIGGHFGTKRELYLAVMDEANRVIGTVMDSRAAELRDAPPERRPEALRRYIDDHIDVCAKYPQIPALWMHRWLADATDIDLDPVSTRVMIQHSVDSVDLLARPAGADARLVMYTLFWCINGFSLGGVLDDAGRRRHADDPEMLDRFRAHMHQVLGRVLRLPDDGPGPLS